MAVVKIEKLEGWPNISSDLSTKSKGREIHRQVVWAMSMKARKMAPHIRMPTRECCVRIPEGVDGFGHGSLKWRTEPNNTCPEM